LLLRKIPFACLSKLKVLEIMFISREVQLGKITLV